jgi:hypothetical protein
MGKFAGWVDEIHGTVRRAKSKSTVDPLTGSDFMYQGL